MAEEGKKPRKLRKPAVEASAALAVKREPTEREIAQRERMKARNLERDERPEIQFGSTVEGGKAKSGLVAANGQDEKLHSVAMMEAFGTRSLPFVQGTLANIQRALSPTGDATEQQYNAALAILAAAAPENEIEATLAAQMVAANDCAMRCMRSMAGSEWADQCKMYGDLANKFMRTFTAQFEALARVRRGGEQIVKHVHVNEGGQAVIAGTINQGRGGNAQDNEQACGAGEPAQSTALPGSDPSWDGVPITGNAERAMPAAWGGVDGRAAE